MIKIGLLGLGNVGRGVVDILSENNTHIKTRVGNAIEVKSIAVRNPEKYAKVPIGDAQLITDIDTVLNDPEISIIVEAMGGEYPAYNYICQALKNGKYVVTANKEVVSKHKETFFKLAKENNVDIYFEAAVAGGIPIIRSLKVGLAANRIESIFGILNGTTNYILSKIEDEQQDFKVILKNAQELGLAESDPTMDVEGIDAAHKLVILAAVAFKANVQLKDIYHEGITQITLKDIQYAKELGYSIKLLAIGHKLSDEEVSLRVHPTLIPEKKLVANVDGAMNAVLVKGNMVGPTLYYGAGAGAEPTASAVVADIIDLARNLESNNTTPIPILGFIKNEIKSKKMLSIKDITSEFYLRISMKNESEVLAKITQVFAQHSISIDAMVQKEIQEDDEIVDIILVTSNMIEKEMNKIINEIEALPENKDKVVKLRIEQLNK